MESSTRNKLLLGSLVCYGAIALVVIVVLFFFAVETHDYVDKCSNHDFSHMAIVKDVNGDIITVDIYEQQNGGSLRTSDFKIQIPNNDLKVGDSLLLYQDCCTIGIDSTPTGVYFTKRCSCIKKKWDVGASWFWTSVITIVGLMLAMCGLTGVLYCLLDLSSNFKRLWPKKRLPKHDPEIQGGTPGNTVGVEWVPMDPVSK